MEESQLGLEYKETGIPRFRKKFEMMKGDSYHFLNGDWSSLKA